MCRACGGISDREDDQVIRLRPATMMDSDDLLSWRNDPLTLACFKSTAEVSQEEHGRWMQFNVLNGYPTHIVMIADSKDGKVGVVRFDVDRSDVLNCDVSVTIAPEWRGHGLAKYVVSSACSYMYDMTINAEIRDWNVPSIKTFENCGFEKTGSGDGFLTYRRQPT